MSSLPLVPDRISQTIVGLAHVQLADCFLRVARRFSVANQVADTQIGLSVTSVSQIPVSVFEVFKSWT